MLEEVKDVITGLVLLGDTSATSEGATTSWEGVASTHAFLGVSCFVLGSCFSLRCGLSTRSKGGLRFVGTHGSGGLFVGLHSLSKDGELHEVIHLSFRAFNVLLLDVW